MTATRRARPAGGGAGRPGPPDARKAARHEQRLVRRLERHRRRRARRSFLWRWRRPLYALAVLVVLGLIGVSVVVSRVELPPPPELAQTTYLCGAEVTSDCGRGNELASLRAEIDREVVTYDRIPPVVVAAVLAAEDRDYFRHSGIDPFGIARAVVRDLQNRGGLQGGSTITQQYVKNAFLSQERTLSRKLREAVLAVKLERARSKEEILTDYLNTIYFGRGAYGVQAASNAYFGHGIELVGSEYDDPATSARGLAKAVYLAGLIRSPETADAYFDPDEAAFRRDSVLDGMVEEGYITLEQDLAARALPFRVAADPANGYVLPRVESADGVQIFVPGAGVDYFVDSVRQWLIDRFGVQQVFAGGLRVYTTLDRGLQESAYGTIYGRADGSGQTVGGVLAAEDAPAGSLVAVDERGHVVAMVGGRDFGRSQVNLALGAAGGGSGRQPGSTFKAFALAAAVEGGLSARSTFPAPSSIVFEGADDGKNWQVSGGGSASGRYDLVEALAQSSNTVYAQLMVRTGAAGVVDLARRMGVGATLPAVPSLVLGSGEVSVLDMASSYATFARRGSFVAPRLVTRVENAQGKVLWTEPPYNPTRVLRIETSDAVTTALAAVVEDGTGAGAAIPNAAAGKTGTTEDYRDAWFVGFSCRATGMLTAAVWMGYPGTDGQPVRPMENVNGVARVGGGTFPAEIWSRFMTDATRDTPDCQLPTTDRFPGQRIDVTDLRDLKATVPAGGFRTTTTVATTTTVVATTTTTGRSGTTTTSGPGTPTSSSSPTTTAAPPTSATTTPATAPPTSSPPGG
jgi:penicillin-binding protein 1A